MISVDDHVKFGATNKLLQMNSFFTLLATLCSTRSSIDDRGSTFEIHGLTPPQLASCDGEHSPECATCAIRINNNNQSPSSDFFAGYCGEATKGRQDWLGYSGESKGTDWYLKLPFLLLTLDLPLSFMSHTHTHTLSHASVELDSAMIHPLPVICATKRLESMVLNSLPKKPLRCLPTYRTASTMEAQLW